MKISTGELEAYTLAKRRVMLKTEAQDVKSILVKLSSRFAFPQTYCRHEISVRKIVDIKCSAHVFQKKIFIVPPPYSQPLKTRTKRHTVDAL
jgi:hypothetical protein